MSTTKSLAELIDALSPEEREATRRFVESLLARKTEQGETLRQDWAGGLRSYRGQYTALALQKKALEWMSED